MSHAITKLTRIQALYQHLAQHPEGISFEDAASVLEIERTTAWRYLKSMEGVIQTHYGVYIWQPTENQIAFAKAILSMAG